MTYSKVTYTYTGGEDKIFTFPFSYINPDYIYVYVNGVATTDFSLDISTSQVTINSNLSDGDSITIQRTTPIDDVLVEFSNLTITKKDDLNIFYEHLLEALQEIKDITSDNGTDLTALGASLSSLYEVVTALISQADNLDVDVDGLTDSLTSLQTLCSTAVTAAQNAQTSADNAQAAADTANSALENCADVNLSNLSEAGIAILEQYGGTGSTGAIELVVWESD